MSEQELNRIVERAIVDQAFRQALGTDPRQALASYDLTAEERAALLDTSADATNSRRVEPRIAKMGGRYDPDEALEIIRGTMGGW